ncbi:chondroitinase-B domain-containing protein [Catellatospora sp. NPDC049609]|uniref:chondroitinase-B domain-containing protein n=1 Tax=Catellatospora sp. NPDC049609 TaxID=3155505 RepID=UPI00342BCAC5
MPHRRLLAVILSAAVTALLAVIAAQPANAATLLADDFESHTTFPAGGWVDDSDTGTWSLAADGSDVARQTSTDSETYLLVNGQTTWQNYTVSARVKVGSTTVRNGIVARFTSSNNYYSLLLHQGKVLLQRKSSGSTTVLQQVAVSYSATAYSRLALEVSGTSLKGYVDGVLHVQATDTTQAGGRIGLYANGVASFDDVLVVDAAGPGPSSPAPSTPPSPSASAAPSPSPSAPPSPSASPTNPPAGGRVVNVSTSSQLTSAFAGAIAGDRIVLADGNYTIGKLSAKHGTATAPITIVAANRGSAVVNAGQLEVLDSSYVTFEGLRWTNSSTLKVTSSNNIRLTRNHFRLTESSSLKWVLVQGANSHHNRIDHNLFEEKHQLGNFITIDGSATQQSQHDLIDHNHFRNIGPRATNEMEAIRVGWSEISQSSGFTTVESNLFENCDGDPEIISVKSNDNVVRYNTFLTSQGTLSHRHGNRGQLYGNFFLGGGKAGTGGIRVYGQDHKIFNNYFQGLTGTGFDAALQLDGGDVDTSGALSAHWRVYRPTVVHNTFVGNVSNIEIGANYSLAPVDAVIADNLVTGGQGKLFNQLKTPVNLTYSGNVAWPTGSATVGVSAPASAIRVADPLLAFDGTLYRIGTGSAAVDAALGVYAYLVDDLDGQPRSGTADVGADERSAAPVLRLPLTAARVGPNAP